MRLIDAEEFKKQIAGMTIINNYPTEKANALCELIDAQPTAYDVDTVVEQLERQAEQYQSRAEKYASVGVIHEVEHMAGKAASYEHAIEIVRGGGQMRLIDADRLLVLIKDQKEKETGSYTKGVNHGLDVIKSIICDEIQTPTAYDVDTVVEQLEEFREEAEQFHVRGMLSDIIEVVKDGGVDAEIDS